jgi:hypothetical protein
MQLAYEEMHVVARVLEESHALVVAGQVVRLPGRVHTKQKLVRVVRVVEEGVANRPIAVQAVEVQAWRTEVLVLSGTA